MLFRSTPPPLPPPVTPVPTLTRRRSTPIVLESLPWGRTSITRRPVSDGNTQIQFEESLKGNQSVYWIAAEHDVRIEERHGLMYSIEER